jgi:hypothetical protein
MISLPLLRQSSPPDPAPVTLPADRRSPRPSLRLPRALALAMYLALLTVLAWAEEAPDRVHAHAHQETTAPR